MHSLETRTTASGSRRTALTGSSSFVFSHKSVVCVTSLDAVHRIGCLNHCRWSLALYPFLISLHPRTRTSQPNYCSSYVSVLTKFTECCPLCSSNWSRSHCLPVPTCWTASTRTLVSWPCTVTILWDHCGKLYFWYAPVGNAQVQLLFSASVTPTGARLSEFG